MSYLGLDIGGSNVRIAFGYDNNSKLYKKKKNTFIKTGNPYMEVELNICRYIDSIIDEIDGIGISLAALMNRDSGEVKLWPNNPCWNNYNLVKHLKRRYKIPVIIEDDANCGAVGEFYSRNNDINNMAYISLGTGIGCGLILNGSLYIGDNGLAGEVGHIFIGKEYEKLICSCGNSGCLQAVASGPAMVRRYNAMRSTNFSSMEQLVSRYIQGDRVSIECFSDMVEEISNVIFNLVKCLDISTFVVGGGISCVSINLISQISKKVEKRINSERQKVYIKKAAYGEYSGVAGALYMAKNN